MSKWVDRAIEEAKKRKSTEPKHQTTNVSSPIRGANQDQSGYGVSHSVADYTISDETVYEVVAGVGAIRSTPVTMQSTPRGQRSANAPASAGRLQRAADIRRRKLDQFAQQQKDQAKQERERLQKEREMHRQQRQKPMREDIGDQLTKLVGIKDPSKVKHEKEEKKTKMTEDKISRFAAFISEQEKRGRGRPKKATTDTGEQAAEKRESLVAQIRDRRADASGHYTVDVDGKSHKVHTSHAQRFLSAHGAARTADQKDAVERKFKADLQSKK